MQPKLIKGDIAVDDRGKLGFVNGFDFKDVKRFYMVENYVGTNIRGWHGHKKEGKYALVTKGWAIFVAKPIKREEGKELVITKFALSADKPEILFIPPGYYHAFQTRTQDTQIMFFSTATLEESKGDDIRLKFLQLDYSLFNVEIR
jgi:dTDP-4-dehydrorhamnose 3,5-epimerase-like enzyme